MNCTYNETGCGGCELLAKANKYRWHDLRKNPDDLPTEDGDYIICLKRWSTISDAWIEQDYKISTFYKGSFDCYMVDMEKPSIVYAWKYIEPFEEEVEDA